MDHDLYAAASAGNIDGVMKLKEKIGQITDDTRQTILHLASLSDKASCVAAILDEVPILLDQLNSRKETALHLAARKGYKDVVEVLVNKSRSLDSDEISCPGIDFIRKGNVDLDTALHLAIRNNHVDVVKLIVEADPSDEHSQNLNFESPLYLAANAGYYDMITQIFKYCSNPSVEGPEGRTALHAAVISHKYYCVYLIIERRRDLSRRADNKGWTPFHYAVSLNFVPELDLIHAADRDKRGLIMSRTSNTKQTALHIAAVNNHIYVLTKLMEYCPDACEEVDEDGRNILHIAAEESHKELIQSILQDFPDNIDKLVNIQDKNGNTPLHLLVLAGCFVPELIKHAKVVRNIKNNDNFTPQELLYLDENIVEDQLMIKDAFEDTYKFQILWLFRYILFVLSGCCSSGPVPVYDRRKKALFRMIWNKREPAIVESLVQPSKRRRKDAKFKIAKTKMMKEEVELYRGRTNTQIIVTALIATVTFTVGFTMPGGNYDGGEANEGLAILSKKRAFSVCMVANAIGLLLSMTSLFLYFISSLYQDPREVSKFIAASTALNIVSVVAMMLTFITGTYVVLSRSPALAITVCAISSIFFIIVIFLMIKLKLDPREKFRV